MFFTRVLNLFSRSKDPEALRNQATLRALRETLEDDHRYMTRHPILKHLYARYESILNDLAVDGSPKTQVEPAWEFSHRVNNIVNEVTNKNLVKRKRRRRLTSVHPTAAVKKSKGKNYHGRTN